MSALTYRYRIKGEGTARRLRKMAIAVNQVWNYAGDVENASKRHNKRKPSAYELMRLTSGSSKMLGLHADTVHATCLQFTRSRDAARHRPRWRVSYGKNRSLGWVPLKNGRSFQVEGDSITYLGKRFRVWLSRPIPNDILLGNFSEDASGNWHLNIVCEVPDDLPTGNGEVGIDLGLKELAALSTGVVISNPRHLSATAKQLAQAQRAGRRSLARKLNRKVAAQRRHFLHGISARIARENSLVCVGDVNSARLVKTRMAKSVLDAGWSALRLMLRYKAIMHGATYVDVDERYSTQTCSCCGSRSGSPRGVKGLGVRAWICGDCGASHDRDVNAARNILRSGRNVALQMTGTLGQ